MTVLTTLVLAPMACSDRATTHPDRAIDASVGVRASGCRSEESIGAGALVAPELVVTVAHVVAGADELAVVDRRGQRHAATTVALDTVDDIALLAVPGLTGTPLEIGPLDAGQSGVYLTYGTRSTPTPEPFEVIRRVNLSISDIYDQGDHERAGLEIAADIDPGDSGAVLVSSAGLAGGLVFASSRRNEDRAWATDLSVVLPLLATLDDQPGNPAPPAACPR